MEMAIKIQIALLIVVLTIKNVYPEVQCSKAGTKIIFINGVLNKPEDAGRSREKTLDIIRAIGPDVDKTEKRNGDFEGPEFYNTSGGIFADFIEAGEQKFQQDFGPKLAYKKLGQAIYDPDFARILSKSKTLRNLLGQISANLANQDVTNGEEQTLVEKIKPLIEADTRVILISHSQGNFFANAVVRNLRNQNHPNLDLVKNLQVASPTSTNEAGGATITNNLDWINFVPSSQGATVSLLEQSCTDDFMYHNYEKIYLSSTCMTTDLITTMDELFKDKAIFIAESFPDNCVSQIELVDTTKENTGSFSEKDFKLRLSQETITQRTDENGELQISSVKWSIEGSPSITSDTQDNQFEAAPILNSSNCQFSPEINESCTIPVRAQLYDIQGNSLGSSEQTFVTFSCQGAGCCFHESDTVQSFNGRTICYQLPQIFNLSWGQGEGCGDLDGDKWFTHVHYQIDPDIYDDDLSFGNATLSCRNDDGALDQIGSNLIQVEPWMGCTSVTITDNLGNSVSTSCPWP